MYILPKVLPSIEPFTAGQPRLSKCFTIISAPTSITEECSLFQINVRITRLNVNCAYAFLMGRTYWYEQYPLQNSTIEKLTQVLHFNIIISFIIFIIIKCRLRSPKVSLSWPSTHTTVHRNWIYLVHLNPLVFKYHYKTACESFIKKVLTFWRKRPRLV